MIWTISGGRIRQRGRSLHEQVISLFPDKKKVYVQRDNRVFLVGYPSYGRLVHRCSQRGEYRSPESRVVCNCHCVGSLCASSPPKHSSGDVLGLRKVTDALPLKLLNKFSPPYRNPMKKKTFHDFADLGGPKELGGSRSMSQTLPVPRKLTLDLVNTHSTDLRVNDEPSHLHQCILSYPKNMDGRSVFSPGLLDLTWGKLACILSSWNRRIAGPITERIPYTPPPVTERSCSRFQRVYSS